jgi:undecaprenyl diphosphate synthase
LTSKVPNRGIAGVTSSTAMPGQVFADRAKDTLSAEERQLLTQIVPEKLPGHVAIIMDGNGRWARERGFADRIRGHEAGITSVRTAVRACGELHLKALTLYAFSVENWQRPKHEIAALMGLLSHFLVAEIDELNDNNVRLVTSGRTQDLPVDVQQTLEKTIDATSANTGLVLNLALSYGGRAEILGAVQEIARQARTGGIDPDSITEDQFSQYLNHPELGDPDLLVRTSGEMRVSNFLLWQIAYTEIHVTPVLWPDFRRAHLYNAILDFQRRERRFGKVNPL